MIAFAFALCFVGLPFPLGFTLPKFFILALLAWHQLLEPGRPSEETWQRLAGPLAFGFAILVISTCRSVDPWMSIEGRFDSWAYGIIPCLFYTVVLLSTTRRPPSRRGFAALGAALAIHAVAQRLNLDPLVPAELLPTGHRAIGYIGNPTDLGAILAMLIFFAETKLEAAAIAAGIWAAGSRGPWLAVAAGCAAQRWPRHARLIAALSLGFFLLPMHQAKDLARQEVWGSAVENFIKNPAFGTGPDTFIRVFDGEHLKMFRALLKPDSIQASAHNDLLQAMATTGLFGLFAYLWLLWRLPATPSLVAMFVFMKFNGAPLEAFAIAAMIAGASIAEENFDGWGL